MSLPGYELDELLKLLIAEHRKLLASMEAQQAAMKVLDWKTLEGITQQQESCRLRIAALETRRRLHVAQLARTMKLSGTVTLTRLAQLSPQRGPAWLKQRDELRSVMAQLTRRTHVAGRLAGAILGHLNTAVRLLAGAVERSGLYTKTGAPRVSRRIGVMEAVG